MKTPMICASLRGNTVNSLIRDSNLANEFGADLVEISLDSLYVRKIENKIDNMEESNTNLKNEIFEKLEIELEDIFSSIDQLSQSIKLPIIYSCKTKDNGGHFQGSEDERIKILKKAIEMEPEWVDLEVEINNNDRAELSVLAKDKTKIIASLYSIDRIPNASGIIQDANDMKDLGDLIKLCYNTNNRSEGMKLFEAAWELKDSDDDNIIMGVGPGADWPQIHAPLLNQFMVFSTTEIGWHLAQKGEINVPDLKTAWSLLQYIEE